MKKKFKPEDWLPEKDNSNQNPKEGGHTERVERSPNLPITPSPSPSGEGQGEDDVEAIISRIETKGTDIAPNYSDWRDIGFAFATSFGEQGRSFFHRVSKFYPGYSENECNKQYDNCLKSTGSGITLNTFFHLAKNAGIAIRTSNPSDPQKESLPTIPGAVYDHLPTYLRKIAEVSATDSERDILLLGTLITLSSCLTKVYGIYHNKKVWPNLYLFVVAWASAGKGILVHCKKLVGPVHKQLREEAAKLKENYERDLNYYNNNKKKNPGLEKPEKPPVKLLFIPANSSATGAFQLLQDNNGIGLIFETEGDTLANTFNTDYGNYSDGFRKAFHHETISYFRRAENEYVDIESPQLSALLSGTPNQITNLISDAENGLFSRFMFYFLDIQPEWVDVFTKYSNNGLDDYFAALGEKFYDFYKILTQKSEIEFTLTVDQQNHFNQTFAHWQIHYRQLLGIDYLATVRRLGLITFRMSMIFSTLRLMDSGELPDKVICEEIDFQNAISITEVLLEHSARIFSELPSPVRPLKRKNQMERFYDLLPGKFSRQDYVNVAIQLKIPDKTAQAYISKFCKLGKLHHDKQDLYLKPAP
jgi:hypothetical protein